ncbi:MAG TPA: tetratricopeptide repeat protein [Spirochaetota bacterium]|nr:tetratricopeptide repeat protein [Spirochaetota bacterium]
MFFTKRKYGFTAMLFRVTIACSVVLMLYHENAFARRKDEVLTIPRSEVIKASVDYIGMTDLLATINTLYLNGYYHLMKRHINEYNKKFPPIKEIYYFTAITLINQKKYEDALSRLYIALALEPAYSRALNAIGYVYALRRQWQQALSYFLLAHRANTYNAFISYNIALLYYLNLDYAHAAAWANKAIDDKPNFARGCDVYACSMYQQQKYDEAVEYWGRALQLGLDEDRVYYNRACAYFAMGNYNRCIADCTKALKKNKKNINALILLAFTHFTLNDYDAALSACNNALKIQNNTIVAAVLRAVCAGKKNAQIGKDMLVATLGSVENVQDVAMKLLQNFQYTIIDSPADFMLY